jgi:2,4-dienoyl-CoA reductase-like NADH-dependent reductase (Old Yellow Enzyme family)
MGRQASADVTGQPTVAPSPIALEGDVTGVRGEKAPHTTPRALTEEDIKQIVADYGTATKNALAAGADFVEIHAANGYLVDQFLQSVSNERTDAYGGSIENRLRFLREVVTSSIAAAGGDSQAVGIRLSPNGNFGGMGSADNNETFDAAIRWLGEQKLAYIHLCDGLGFGFHELSEPYTLPRGRAILKDVDASTTRLIGAVGYTKETAVERLEEGNADLIAFGRPFMSNPDLTYRFEKDLPLADTADYAHWWGWQLNEEGFTTYQAAQEA